jgi:FkbM family methyltransferase
MFSRQKLGWLEAMNQLISSKIQLYTNKINSHSGKFLRKLHLKHHFNTRLGSFFLPRQYISDQMLLFILLDEYEKEELSILEKHLEPNDVVIELGAGIGFLANYYCRAAVGKHIAIEASPDLCQIIAQNTGQFQNLTILNGVASKNSGEHSFHIYQDYWASSLYPVHLDNPALQLVKTVSVPAIDLDQLIIEQQATCLICDIEGGEKELFEQFELNVPKIILELHWQILGHEQSLKILNRLVKRGYKLQGSQNVVIAIKK